MAYLDLDKLKIIFINSYLYFISVLIKNRVPHSEVGCILHNAYIDLVEKIVSNEMFLEEINIRSYISQNLAWRAKAYFRSQARNKEVLIGEENIHNISDSLISRPLIEQLSDLNEKSQEFEILKECFNKLGKKNRALVYYYIFKNMKSHEVAEKLNMTATNVRQVWHSSKSVLEECIRRKRIEYGL